MNKNKLEKIGIVILSIVILVVMIIGINESQSNHVLYRVTPYFDDNNELANRCKYRSIFY